MADYAFGRFTEESDDDMGFGLFDVSRIASVALYLLQMLNFCPSVICLERQRLNLSNKQHAVLAISVHSAVHCCVQKCKASAQILRGIIVPAGVLANRVQHAYEQRLSSTQSFGIKSVSRRWLLRNSRWLARRSHELKSSGHEHGTHDFQNSAHCSC